MSTKIVTLGTFSRDTKDGVGANKTEIVPPLCDPFDDAQVERIEY